MEQFEDDEDDNEDDEEAELVGANFRRESELSELQQRLRSDSATDGRLFYSGGQMPGKCPLIDSMFLFYFCLQAIAKRTM